MLFENINTTIQFASDLLKNIKTEDITSIMSAENSEGSRNSFAQFLEGVVSILRNVVGGIDEPDKDNRPK